MKIALYPTHFVHSQLKRPKYSCVTLLELTHASVNLNMS